MYLTRKTGVVLGAAVLLAAAGALAASPASAQPLSQLWLTHRPGEQGPIINQSSGQCLTQDTAAGVGVPVATLQHCTGADDQLWFSAPGRLGLIRNERSHLILTQGTVAGIGLPVVTLQPAG